MGANRSPSDVEKSHPLYNSVYVLLSSKNSIDSEASIIAKRVFQGAIASAFVQKEREVTSKIDIDLQDQALVVREVAEGYISPQKTHPDRPKIGLTIGFFCDIDAIDHNGSILSRVLISIEQNI